MTFSPDSTRIVAVLSGFSGQGFQVVDRRTQRVVQTVKQPASFLGACFDTATSLPRGSVARDEWRCNSVCAIVPSCP
jgi:hypothetical protein